MTISRNSLIFASSALKLFKTEKSGGLFSLNESNGDQLLKVDLEGIPLRGVVFDVNIQFLFALSFVYNLSFIFVSKEKICTRYLYVETLMISDEYLNFRDIVVDSNC